MLVIRRKFRLVKEISATSKNSNLFFIQEFLVSCKFKLSVISKILPHRELCVHSVSLFQLEFEMQLLKTEDFDLLDVSTVFRGFHSGWSEEECPLQILIKVSYNCVLAEIALAQHCNFRVHSQNPITLPAKTQLIRCVLASAALRDSFALNFSILTGVWERTLRDYFIKTLTCPNTCELERSYFHLSSLK